METFGNLTRNILFILAHPDDEVFGPSGTIHQLAQKHNVHVICTFGGSKYQKKDYFKKSMSLLNVENYEYLNFEPYTRNTRQEIIDIYRRYVEQANIDTIYTHWFGDFNSDHRFVSELAFVVGRPYNRQLREFYYFPTITTTEISREFSFKPMIYNKLSNENVELKLELINIYKMGERKYSKEHVLHYLKFYGSQILVDYAEVFMVGYVKHL